MVVRLWKRNNGTGDRQQPVSASANRVSLPGVNEASEDTEASDGWVLGEFGKHQLFGGDYHQLSYSTQARAIDLVMRAGWVRIGDLVSEAEASGELWQVVGAMKLANEFLDSDELAAPFFDAGIRALAKMRITNPQQHLSGREFSRYRMHFDRVEPDNFWGPAVFESEFGPSRQFFLDAAVASVSARKPIVLFHEEGVEMELDNSIDLDSLFFKFGSLIYRGPLVMSLQDRDEAQLIHPIVAAISSRDHKLGARKMVDRVSENAIMDSYSFVFIGLGLVRFIEDYLDPSALALEEARMLRLHCLQQLQRMGVFRASIARGVFTQAEIDALALVDED